MPLFVAECLSGIAAVDVCFVFGCAMKENEFTGLINLFVCDRNPFNVVLFKHGV